jgi:hypothetical protein
MIFTITHFLHAASYKFLIHKNMKYVRHQRYIYFVNRSVRMLYISRHEKKKYWLGHKLKLLSKSVMGNSGGELKRKP